VTGEDEVIERLRAFGSRPVPDQLRRRHLSLFAGADHDAHAPRPLPRRRALVAAIAAMALVVAGAVSLLSRDDSERRSVFVDDGTATSQQPSSGTTDDTATDDQTEGQSTPEAVPVDPFPGDPCKGPPLFANQDPLSPARPGGDGGEGAGRQADSDSHEAECDEPPLQGPNEVPPGR
jgi:hypothetical protein